MLKLFFCVSIFTLFSSSKCEDVESRIVNICQGPVKGYKNADWDIFEFYGIPYATRPTGENKFKAPLPPTSWTSTFEAVKNNIICPQNETMLQRYLPGGYETENCLVANVFVSNTNDTNKPVFVNIPGGGYYVGYGGFLEPKTMVEEGNIVAVTFNYRLGVEGFLCLGTEKIPGNAGMKDMVALLRWVKENIASFGGNPDDITLGGYSAGSSAADLLLLSDMTDGLFHKIIPESGISIAPWALQLDPYENAKAFAEENGAIASTIEELETFYTTGSYELSLSNFVFGPCIENAGEDSFLVDTPLNIMKSGEFRKLPVLTGHNSAEGYEQVDLFDSLKDSMNANFSAFLPADLTFTSDTEKANVAQEVKEYYFGNMTVSEETFQGYINYFGDTSFVFPNIESVELQAEAGSNSVYYYIYSFFDNTTVPPFMQGGTHPIQAAFHSAQTLALLNRRGVPKDYAGDSEDYKEVKQYMLEIWLNFIKTGNPVPDVSARFPDGWPTAASEATPYMRLDKTPQLMTTLPIRAELWEKIYEKYYKQPIAPPASD